MARECGDCYWCESKHSAFDYLDYHWRCKKRGRRVEIDDPACSEFRSEDTKTCQDCDYYEGGKYKWSTSAMCNLRGIKRNDDDKACPSFCE